MRESFEHVGPIAEEWDALADRMHAPPWLRPGWMDAWWASFGRGQLELVCLWRDGRLAGVLPHSSRFGELRSTSNSESPRFGILCEDTEASLQILRSLFDRCPRRLTLFPLQNSEPELDQSVSCAEVANYRLLMRTIGYSPYIVLDSDWEGYRRQRSRKLVTEIRRRRKRLEEEGHLSLTVEDGTEELDQLLDGCFKLEAAGWKGQVGTAMASKAGTARFYRALAHWAARRGSLRLAFLKLDGRMLAFDFSIEEGGTHYLLKTSYDPAFGRLGPGILIRSEMLARCFENNLERYEFLGRDEPWKHKWTDTSHNLVLFRAFAPSLAGLIDWSSRAYGRPVVGRLQGLVRR